MLWAELLFHHLIDISSLLYFYSLLSKLLLPTGLPRTNYAADVYHFLLMKLFMHQGSFRIRRWYIIPLNVILTGLLVQKEPGRGCPIWKCVDMLKAGRSLLNYTVKSCHMISVVLSCINFGLSKDQIGINLLAGASKNLNVELLQRKRLRANPQISLQQEQTSLAFRESWTLWYPLRHKGVIVEMMMCDSGT